MLPWIGYTRVSRVGDRTETLISPDQQRDRIEAYAAAHGFEVEMLEPELDVSGGKVDRPVLDEAIGRVTRGEARGVIVAQLDRLSRMDIVDALQTIRRIEAAGGKAIAVAEDFDTTTPEGRMSRNMFLALGEMQLDRYRGQFRAAKRQAIERGIWPTRTVPIGYRLGRDRCLEPDPATRDKVVGAFEARAAGASWRQVGEILRRGPSGASRVIANRVYLGELRLRDADDGEWMNTTAHQALVSRAVWEAAQIGQPRPPRGSHGPALLTGLVRCASCRRSMTPDSYRDGRRSYRCRAQAAAGRCAAPAWISMGPLDAYVEQIALTVIEPLRYEAVERREDLQAAEESLTDAEVELAAYQDAVDVAEVGAEHFARGMRTRVEAVELTRRDLGRLRMAAVPVSQGGSLGELWGDLGVEERGQVLRGALDVVWVRRGRGVEGRVRVIAAGFEPDDLPRPGGGRQVDVAPIDWPGTDMPGELRLAPAQDSS